MNLETQADRDRAVTVPCPYPRCGAGVGVSCRNPHTGESVRFYAAHDARLKAAGVMHAPLDARELRRG